jgi:hypothetical protein
MSDSKPTTADLPPGFAFLSFGLKCQAWTHHHPPTVALGLQGAAGFLKTKSGLAVAPATR